MPQVLGDVPVLRRVLAQVRGVALEELQDRVPRRSTSSALRRTASNSGLNDRPLPAADRRRRLQRGAARSRPPPSSDEERRATATARQAREGRQGWRPSAEHAPQEGQVRRAALAKKKTDEERCHETNRATCLLALLLARSSPAAAAERRGPKSARARRAAKGERRRQAVSPKTRRGFNAALEAMVAHDKANDWNDATCSQRRQDVPRRRRRRRSRRRARLSRGASTTRASRTSAATRTRRRRRSSRRSLRPTRSSTAPACSSRSTSYEKGRATSSGDRRAQQAVTDAKFQNVEALVNLAMLQMKRGATRPGQRTARTTSSARRRTCSARSPSTTATCRRSTSSRSTTSSMAKQKAGARVSRRASAAATFAQDARRPTSSSSSSRRSCARRPSARTRTTRRSTTPPGSSRSSSRTSTARSKSSRRRRKLDPKFFEAQMNYAAVNLSFRGFEAGRRRRTATALKMRPNDYDAHLGLALALRGQINDVELRQARRRGAGRARRSARSSTPERAETYYNEAILTQEYKAKASDKDRGAGAREGAAAIFRQFVDKAGGDAGVRRRREALQGSQRRTSATRSSSSKRVRQAAAIDGSRSSCRPKAPAPADARAAPPADGKVLTLTPRAPPLTPSALRKRRLSRSTRRGCRMPVHFVVNRCGQRGCPAALARV